MKYLLPILLCLSPTLLSAQFGQKRVVFTSEAAYPSRISAGDVDGDGVIDAAFINNSANGFPRGIYWVRNLSDGQAFSTRELMIELGSSAIDKYSIVDIDHDGDGDLVVNSSWYRNNGNSPFEPMGSLATGAENLLLFHDWDEDGVVDDVGRTATGIVMLRNQGDGTLEIGPPIGSPGLNTTTVAAMGDLDGDGKMDLIIGGNNDQVGWYRNEGGGSFDIKRAIPELGPAGIPYCGDVNGDGKTDLIIFGLTGGTIWLANDGSGNFSLGGTIPTGIQEVMADFDGDGDIDFSMPTGSFCDVKMLRNDGGNTWTPITIEVIHNYFLSGGNYGLGDLNSDGRPDLLMSNGNDMTGFYPNNGDGTLGIRKRIARTVGEAEGLSASDLDLDGDIDFVTSSYAGDWVCWYPNNGDGTFAPQVLLAENLDSVFACRIADLNGDGLPDIITNKPSHAWLRNNNGAASFTPMTLPNNGFSRQETDLDGDGDLDLVGVGEWYENDGNGNFTIHPEPLLTVSNYVEAGDLNSDGSNDLVIGGYRYNGPPTFILLNDGNGNFTASQTLITYQFRIGDLDGDGDLDMLSFQLGSRFLRYLNDGSGSFTVDTAFIAQFHAEAQTSRDFLLADINGDDLPDVIWAYSAGYQHRTYLSLNVGGGNFETFELIDIANGSVGAMVLADINNDAVPDLVSAGARTVLWQANNYFNAFRVRGSVFMDYDIDAVLDTTERKVPFQLIQNDVNNILVWTNSAGNYDLPAEIGDAQIWTRPPSAYRVTNNPDTLTANLTENFPIATGADFGLAPVVTGNEQFLSIVTSDIARCNSSNIVWIDLRNTGTIAPENILIDLEVSPDITVNSVTPAPDSVANGHWYWHIDSLGWFQTQAFRLELGMGQAGSTSDVRLNVSGENISPREETIFSGIVICSSPPISDTTLVSVSAPDFARCNSSAPISITLQGDGENPPSQVVVDLEISPDINLASLSPAPDTIYSGHYYWYFEGPLYSDQFIHVELNIGPVGSASDVRLTVSGENFDTVVKGIYSGPVRCAYDPNDKQVKPQGYGEFGAVDINTEWLQYTIRFQNTGTDTAFTVVIRDQLDVDLDPASLEILASSHPLTRIQVDTSREAIFEFSRIMLPDSVVDEPGSHGFVKYRIRPTVGAGHLTEITNTAGIYFDMNPPIITNTVLNTLVDCSLHAAQINVEENHFTANEGFKYQWYLNDEAIAGATSQTINPQITGNYSVEVSSIYGCAARSNQQLYYNSCSVSGSVYIDNNLNAMLDSGERKVPFKLVQNSGTNLLVWTNSYGNYELQADTGSYTLWTTAGAPFQVTNIPDSLTAILTVTHPNATGLDFGLTESDTQAEQILSVAISNNARCNNSSKVWVTLSNSGSSIPHNIVVDLQLNPNVIITSATPSPDSVSNGHMYWSIDSLGWLSSKTFSFHLNFGAEGSASDLIVTVNGEGMKPLEEIIFSGPITCAYDSPNKMVKPQGFGEFGAVDADIDWLQYTIRFQNNSADTVTNVVVRDVLDIDLDPSSMEILASSHPLTNIQVDSSREAIFEFSRIMLPDSTADEAGSQGFVSFRIRPVAGSGHLTEITNTAEIYFDLNTPIITNTVLNTLVDCSLHSAQIQIEEDRFSASEGSSYQWYLNDEAIAGATSQTINPQITGNYSVEVASEFGCTARSGNQYFLTTGLSQQKRKYGITVIPNPMSTLTQIHFATSLDKTYRVELVEISGRVLLSKPTSGNMLTIERGNLNAGLYFLRLIQQDGCVIAQERIIIQ